MYPMNSPPLAATNRWFALGIILTFAGCVFQEAAPPAAQPVSSVDPIEYVAPELQKPLAALIKALHLDADQALNAENLPQMREQYRKAAELRPLPAPVVEERMIPGAAGAPDVRIYVIGAKSDAARPVIVHTHGGGFVSGTAKTALLPMQKLALAHDCVVVTVDYRLAPETPFPGSLEDNYAALKWVFANADTLGVDRKRIALMGESAGGGHAAMLAIAARDRGEIPIRAQFLIYPMLDDRTGSTVITPPWMGRYIWTASANRFGWSSLLGVPAGSKAVPAGAVPARVESLRGLPQTFIGVGSIDLFANEDIEYARRLMNAGVATELQVVQGGFHGFDNMMPNSDASIRFKTALDAAIKRAFAPDKK